MNALVNAKEDTADDIHQQTQGFIFLGTPHKGAQLTMFGKLISLFGYWKGSSTTLLEVIEPDSTVNENLHDSFMAFLSQDCGVTNTVCVFEAVKESFFGFPITHVSC